VHEKNQPPAQPPMQQPIQQPQMPPVMPPRPMPIPKHPCFSPDMTGGAGAYTWMYPDIYYKIQPHVTMACDEMDMNGWMMPTRKMMLCMCDRIHENVVRMYPEMRNYTGNWYAAPMMQVMDDDMPLNNGPIKDIIAILLLSELFRRRRVY
jgi:hypothetical protein